jgi:hypothetical protein
MPGILQPATGWPSAGDRGSAAASEKRPGTRPLLDATWRHAPGGCGGATIVISKDLGSSVAAAAYAGGLSPGQAALSFSTSGESPQGKAVRAGV